MKGTSGRGRAAAKAAGGSSLAQRGGLEPSQAAVREPGYREGWKRSPRAPGLTLEGWIQSRKPRLSQGSHQPDLDASNSVWQPGPGW